MNMARLSPQHISNVLQHAVKANLIDDLNPWIVFHNLDLFREKLHVIRDAFPAGSLHTLAIKANPLLGLLRIAVSEGFGLEAASFEEVHLALAAECPPERIVFDSPVKTKTELAHALRLGISINADNFEELHRINKLIGTNCCSKIGLRINPEVGAGRIRSTSVANSDSKLGVPLNSNSNAILTAFEHFPWLNGLHLHVGSQGCDLALLLAAAKRVSDLAESISDCLGKERLEWIDIGGGVPAYYRDDAIVLEFCDYARALREAAPALFSSSWLLITEFGRAIQANCGWAVSRIEYVKLQLNTVFAVAHFGADFLMRAVYAHQDWAHEFLLCDGDGVLKDGLARQVAIAGPLCFADDIPGRHVEIPEPAIHDLVVVRDTGAYTLSLWSRHCNRAMPMVVGYSRELEELQFDILLHREKPADIINQWNNTIPK